MADNKPAVQRNTYTLCVNAALILNAPIARRPSFHSNLPGVACKQRNLLFDLSFDDTHARTHAPASYLERYNVEMRKIRQGRFVSGSRAVRSGYTREASLAVLEQLRCTLNSTLYVYFSTSEYLTPWPLVSGRNRGGNFEQHLSDRKITSFFGTESTTWGDYSDMYLDCLFLNI